MPRSNAIMNKRDAGTTKIGLPKPTALMDVLQNPYLQAIATEVEATLIQAINEAK